MALRSWVWLINSRSTFVSQSTPLSSQDPERLETFVGVETNEATEEVTYEEHSREGGQEEGERRKGERGGGREASLSSQWLAMEGVLRVLVATQAERSLFTLLSVADASSLCAGRTLVRL
jgi:hypothetical protein